jgi:RNA polymerase sigma factor (sigma-70 family)
MQKENEIFLELINENKGIIIKICNMYCQNKEDKDDLSQEIVYNLWKAFPSYVPQYKVTTWMYRIALNIAISFYRKEKRVLDFVSYDESLIVFEETDNIELEADLILLQGFIQQLGEIDRSIILLYLDDKPYNEIASIIGLTETNIATKISRIKYKLKEQFSNKTK